MGLSEEIATIISSRSLDLHLLLQFVKDFDAYIQQYRDQTITDLLSDMSDDTKKEYGELVEEFVELWKRIIEEAATTKGNKTKEYRFRKRYSKEALQYFSQTFQAGFKPISYPRFLYDMALIYTIAMLESLLSDFLATILALRPNTLKSESTATYEDILSFSSMEKLIGYLAINRVEKILNGDLRHGVADNLNKTFSIDISEFDKFDIIHEAFCRRHIIVHNDGFTDKEYCKKIPESQTGEKLRTDLQYIETLIKTIGQFIDYLDDYFSRKMRYRRYPLHNKLLNPPKHWKELKEVTPLSIFWVGQKFREGKR